MRCSHFITLNVTLFKWFNYKFNIYESDVRVRARYTLELNNDDSSAITLWVVCIYLKNDEIQRYFRMKRMRNTSHKMLSKGMLAFSTFHLSFVFRPTRFGMELRTNHIDSIIHNSHVGNSNELLWIQHSVFNV